jgi:diaminopimelate epimerase
MIPFTKMQGIGNDYVYVNCLEMTIDDPSALAAAVSDRHYGIGSDGLILILPSDKADYRMRMFNSDGSESEMCGNGIRCFSKYLYDRALFAGTHVSVETAGGIKHIDVEVSEGKAVAAKVDMGQPRLDRELIPMKGAAGRVINEKLELSDGVSFNVTCVSMGNPHCVIFVDDVKNFPVMLYGSQIENHPLFPSRTNVEFVTVMNSGEVIQRTWERGAGETMACGTGASAVCIAGFLTGRTGRSIVSHLSGGDLNLSWDEASDHLFMSGPAVEVFEGTWPD